MQSIRNPRNDRRAHDTLSAAMEDERPATGASSRTPYTDPDAVIVGDVARRLREANERAFRSSEKPWGRSWLARLLSRDKDRD